MKRLLMVAAALASAGCTALLPPGYVEIADARDYEWRGMSSEGAVAGLRVRKHDPEGTLDFWTEVVRKELELQKGYAFLGSEELTSGTAAGRALRFSVPGAEGRSYWVALFLTEWRCLLVFPKHTLTTLEVAGPAATVERDLPAIRKYVSTLKL